MHRETNGRGDAVEFPKIISVDDHIIEPPDLWTRLPKAMAEFGPQCQREKGAFAHAGGSAFLLSTPARQGHPPRLWVYCHYLEYQGLSHALSTRVSSL
jgi:hypothetical protein